MVSSQSIFYHTASITLQLVLPLPASMVEELYGHCETRNIKRLSLGDLEFDTWFGNASYTNPKTNQLAIRQKPITKGRTEKLFLCDSCFKYSDIKRDIDRHREACRYTFYKHHHRQKLPGKVMYKNESYEIRRVKCFKHRLFLQNLCLFTKCFMENKSVFFSLDYFDFFIAYGSCASDENKVVPLGFFSKELLSWDGNNLACIFIFPPYQRMGLSQLLISFSYELSKWENVISGPEHPLSKHGEMGYLSFWCKTVAREVLAGKCSRLSPLTLKQISSATGFRIDDVVRALRRMNSLIQMSKSTSYALYDGYDLCELGDMKYIINRDSIQKWVKQHNVALENPVRKSQLIMY